MRFSLVAATIGGMLFGIPHPTAAQNVAPARGDISGYWHYNVTRSDRPPSGFGDNAGETSRGGFGGGRRGSGSAGGGGGIGGGMGGRPAISEAERSRIRQAVQLATNAPSTLRIFRNDSMVTLVEEAIADTLRLYTNGKKRKEQVEGAGDVETRAEWKDNSLIIERKVNGGGKVTETYFRTSDNRQMMVIVKLETSKSPKPVEFRRVYDAVSGGS